MKSCCEICFSMGEKKCEMFVGKLEKFDDGEKGMRFYGGDWVL